MSISGIVLAPTAPHAFLNVSQWISGKRDSANNVGVFRVELPTGTLTLMPEPKTPDDVDWPAQPTSTWISQVLSTSSDGHIIHAITAYSVPTDDGASIDYWLARYFVDDGRVEPVHHLPAIFA